MVVSPLLLYLNHWISFQNNCHENLVVLLKAKFTNMWICLQVWGSKFYLSSKFTLSLQKLINYCFTVSMGSLFLLLVNFLWFCVFTWVSGVYNNGWPCDPNSVVHVRRVADFTFSVFGLFVCFSIFEWEWQLSSTFYRTKWKLANQLFRIYKLSQILVFALLDIYLKGFFCTHQTEEKKITQFPPLS